jgi:hypothetical protein
MDRRLAKISRIVAVQKQMHRLAEWQLIDLQRQEAELQERARLLIESLNGDTPLHGLFVESTAKRLRRVGMASGAVAKARETQTERVVGERRKLRHVERIEEATALEAEREAEKSRLEQIIENASGRANGKPSAAPGHDS